MWDHAHAGDLGSDLALNDLIRAVELLQKNILIQGEDGIEAHEKGPDGPPYTLATELQIAAIQESSVRVIKHPPNSVLKLNQLPLRPLLCEGRGVSSLELRQRIFESASGLILPQQITQLRVRHNLRTAKQVFEGL